MRTPVLRLAVLCTPLLLAACGEGWEVQKTTEYLPYGNQRTAGSGVVYVRAKLMPQKELKVEAPKTVESPEEQPAPAIKAEKIFSDAQGKGAHSASPEPTPEPDNGILHGDGLPKTEVPAEKPEKSSSLLQFEQPQAKEIQKQASASLLAPSAIQPQAGDEAMEYQNAVVPPTKMVALPESEIVSPKKDFMMLSSEGQRSLSEIYDDTF